MTATQTLKMNNPYSKIGLKRRPTYDEIIGLISENETITGKLPNRDATFFKRSPEGSFFDGSDSLEVLKDEQERLLSKQMGELLLRQNSRRNGTTFHSQRMQRLPATSPTIEQPTQPMDVEAQAQTQSAPTTQAQTQSAPTAPTVSSQSTQLNTELQQKKHSYTKTTSGNNEPQRRNISTKQTNNNRTDTSYQSTQKLCTNKTTKLFYVR